MSRSNPSFAFFLQDLDGGGAERAIVRLAGDIAELGHTVDLVVGDADSDYREEVSAKIKLVNFSARSPIKIFLGLATYLRRQNPTVIMSALDPPNIMLVAAAKLTRFKGRTVISQRAVLDASLRELNLGRRIVTWSLMRICFQQADTVISNSYAAAIEVRERLNVHKKKVCTIQNAINVDHIRKLALEPLNSHFANRSDEPLILCVGSLTKRKDMETLIRAFALVRECRQARLTIVGKGPERPKLENLITTLGLDNYAQLAGFEPNPYKWINAASVFASASTEEGFPNVIAESLALGCPVVATDCPGDTANLLGNGKWGRLVPMGDPERMADAILAALDDPNPPDGKMRAASFSPSMNTAAYLDVLIPKTESISTELSETI